ncbi:MAG: diguanylate cyclase [Oscillospiraceae bacterium]|nr:diguanylate cyclase [Oscillospiraceae bacterium]
MSVNIPDSFAEKLVSMMRADEDTIHFYWSPRENVMIQLTSTLFPEGVDDPLYYIRESGMVDEQSLPLFDVFCAKIQSGILSGISSNSAATDVSIKIPGSRDFVMCHLFALFMRDDNNKITDIHFNLRPYSLKEQFDRDVLTYFTSDKNPKLFTKRCQNTIKANPDKNIAFIQFDVERFKLINETLGVEVGDELLQFFSDSLALVCSEEQPYCRLTADVFMIVTTFDTRDDLVAFIRKIESMLCGYNGMDYRLVFGVSVV